VNIHAKPEQFLDWDKPIWAQNPEVAKVLDSQGYGTFPPIQGAPIPPRYQSLAPVTELKNPSEIAALGEAGIPGIKYLDQGSRAAGEGSSNYVLFRDDIIDIVKKYGLAGLGIMGLGAGTAKSPQQN
jgi:hypothetical protein